MRNNVPRFGLAAGLMVMSAQAVSGQTTNDPLLSALQTVAALPGAPSSVAAAGLTRANERLLTLEHTRSVGDQARRLVIVGGLDGTPESAQAVLEALRWFKSDAPDVLRRAWTITALPCADPPRCSTEIPGDGRVPSAAGRVRSAAGPVPSTAGPVPGGDQAFPPEDGFYNHDTSPELRYVWRWVAFQAPDLVLEVRSGQTQSWEISGSAGTAGTPALDGPRPPDGTLAAAISTGTPSGLAPVASVRVSTNVDGAPRMLRTLLEAATSLGRSPLRDVQNCMKRNTMISGITRMRFFSSSAILISSKIALT